MPSNEERRVEILRYVLDRQKAKQRTTKSEVIRHMRGMSAVNTTHGLIMDLIKEGKLNVEVLNSQVHFLTIGEKFDFNNMQRELLKSKVEEVMKLFDKLSRPDRVNIKITKRLKLREYNYSIQVYGGATKEEIDEAVQKAIPKLKEKEKTKTFTEQSEKSG